MDRAIIFDVDGTLSETEETHRRAFNRAFESEGLDWHWDSVTNKKPAPDVYELALRELDLPAEACVAIEDSRKSTGLQRRQDKQVPVDANELLQA